MVTKHQGASAPNADVRPQFLTLQQAAAHCATPAESIRFWIYVGKLEAYKPGRQVLVRATDLDALIESHRVSDMRIVKAFRHS